MDAPTQHYGALIAVFIVLCLVCGVILVTLRQNAKTRFVQQLPIILNNLDRLNSKSSIPISIEKLRRVQTHIKVIRELMELSKNDDLSNSTIDNEIYVRAMECVKIYTRAGVPHHRIVEPVTD